MSSKKLTRTARKSRNCICEFINDYYTSQLISIHPFIIAYDGWQKRLQSYNYEKDTSYIKYVITHLGTNDEPIDISDRLLSISSSVFHFMIDLDRELCKLDRNFLGYNNIGLKQSETELVNNLSSSLKTVDDSISHLNDQLTAMKAKLIDNYPSFYEITKETKLDWDLLVKTCYAYNMFIIVEFPQFILRGQIMEVLKKQTPKNIGHSDSVAKFLEYYLDFIKLSDRIYHIETEAINKQLSTIESLFKDIILNPFFESWSCKEREGYSVDTLVDGVVQLSNKLSVERMS